MSKDRFDQETWSLLNERNVHMSASQRPPVLARLHEAMNQHDLEAFVACFDPAYRSEQPTHPDRAFGGVEQVRKNWSTLFSGIANFRGELLRSSSDGKETWAEWEWTGAKAGGERFLMRGVTIFGVDRDRINWGRLYMVPVEAAGPGIDAAVKGMAGRRSAD
jgi:hypothetical protein